MRLIRVLFAALVVALAPVGAAAQDNEVVVRGTVAKVEIERILLADNLDAGRLSARQIADAISSIERGRAPDDFWTAYQAHVRAWRDFADAETESQIVAQNDPDSLSYVLIRLARAEQLIETTFDEVERVALNYGARIPIPPGEIRRTT